jgi:hypothetical protein
MLLLSQCVTFAPWAATFWYSWTDDGYTKTLCDTVETQDMLRFQQFLADVPITERLPDIKATGVPLSTILVAHHNLVTYGVPFQDADNVTWTNPAIPPPPKGPKKRFYAPTTAVAELVGTKMFQEDALVREWFASVNLEPDAVKNVPGMAKWVRVAEFCFSLPSEPDPSCEEIVGTNWYQTWLDSHPKTSPHFDSGEWETVIRQSIR